MKIINPNTLSLLLEIWSLLYDDTAPCESTHESDKDYVRERLRREGLSFLTVSLPSLGKAFERGFESRFECPPGFKKRKGTVLPQFMFRAFSQVFHPSTGEWLGKHHGIPFPFWNVMYSDMPDVVGWIRQLLLMFYKLELPYTPDSLEQTKIRFIETEARVQSLDWPAIWVKRMKELILMRALIGDLFRYYRVSDEKPAHGPGSSACGRPPWSRYKPRLFVERIHEVFPYQEWFTLSDKTMSVTSFLYSMGAPAEPSAKVVFVPKDSRGPRLISEEPEPFMYIQQGIKNALYRMFDRHPYAQRTLSCLDQTRNRSMALYGTSYGTTSTIDIKDASDSIPLELVRAIFPQEIVVKLEACRSLGTTFPDGTYVPLSKFAPMGSACCFPVEAIVFWAATLVAAYGDAALSVVRDRRKAPEITVYGDDIIVPTSAHADLVGLLSDFGIKANEDKSFRTGPFRESCGLDAFLSRDVSIVRLKHLPYFSKGDSDREFNNVGYAKLRLSEFMNNVIRRHGTWITPKLRSIFERYYGRIPVLRKEGPSGLYLLGPHDDGLVYRRVSANTGKRSNPPCVDYDRPRIRLLVEKPVKQRVNVDDWSHILRSLLGKGGDEGSSVVTPRKRTRVRYEWTWY